MQEIHTNAGLTAFLTELASMLRSRGATHLVDSVHHASRFGSGSPTELLGEARIALIAVQSDDKAPLSDDERAAVAQAISTIDIAFRAVGHAPATVTPPVKR